MNTADLARLELAKRAFRATEPNATEVQRGVRRARLALQRPKARRRWFSKGAVMLVLAVGGLAYAKPQALSEFVGSALESSQASAKHSQVRGAAALTLPRDPSASSAGQHEPVQPLGSPAAEPAPAVVTVPTRAATDPARAVVAPKTPDATRAAAPMAVDARQPPHASVSAPAPKVRAGGSTEAAASPAAISDWGRVAQALAQGDETKALSALNTLSESDDQRTRDKADLGRAQLYMANGEREAACSLARDLTHRQAGSRIDRQAQAILKSCK